jgi:hypothetical protein
MGEDVIMALVNTGERIVATGPFPDDLLITPQLLRYANRPGLGVSGDIVAFLAPNGERVIYRITGWDKEQRALVCRRFIDVDKITVGEPE